jgi:hypothetical protein
MKRALGRSWEVAKEFFDCGLGALYLRRQNGGRTGAVFKIRYGSSRSVSQSKDKHYRGATAIKPITFDVQSQGSSGDDSRSVVGVEWRGESA